ncbi:MAG: TldD/PmbA family protein [Deltaproteobacteria bacterium]|nr:MAG: TldD/PmbA family protein [Deltaproteobacteria bacterium]
MSIPRPPGPPGAWFEDRFGVTRELLRKVMAAALSRGGDDCDLFFEHSASTSVSLSDGKVNAASTRVDLGMGVRVIVGDQVGYAFTEELTPEAMIAAARTAAEIARTTGRRDIADPQPVQVTDRSPVLQPWHEVDMATRVAMVRDWEQRAFSRDPRIQRVETHLSDAASTVMIVRPDGRLVEDWRPMTSGYVRTTVVHDGVRESSAYNVAGRAGLEFYSPDRQARLVDEAVARTLFLLDAGKPPAGEMPVVLAAGPSAILLHEAIGHGMEADFNRKGTSIYASRLGKRVANDMVTIIDDGTIPGSRGSVNVDDEGNPGQRTVLVEEGVLRTYLHDEISARHYGVAPTGSGRRQGFRHAPLPRMRATIMANGPHSAEEIIASVDKGLYCQTFANGQVQIGAGDFAFYMKTGFLIENGRLTRPVKDVNIIGNGPQALERIDMVANDMVLDEGGWTCGKEGQGVPVSQGMPTVRVQSLVVGGVG